MRISSGAGRKPAVFLSLRYHMGVPESGSDAGRVILQALAKYNLAGRIHGLTNRVHWRFGVARLSKMNHRVRAKRVWPRFL